MKNGISKLPDAKFRIEDEDDFQPINNRSDSFVTQKLSISEENDLQNPHVFNTTLYTLDENQTNQLQDFEVKAIIGKGSFGKVFAVVEKQTGKVFAMKAISKDLLLDQNCIESTLLEKEILLENHHPFLINMSYVFQTQMKIYFVMRFARGGDL